MDNELNAAEVAKMLWTQTSIEDATEAIVRYVLALKALRMPFTDRALAQIRKATNREVA